MTRAERLRGPEIEAAIREYGCKLVDYPESINLDVIEVQGGECRQWNIVAPIYTAEEGISDLGMELTVYESGDASKIALENIRVR